MRVFGRILLALAASTALCWALYGLRTALSTEPSRPRKTALREVAEHEAPRQEAVFEVEAAREPRHTATIHASKEEVDGKLRKDTSPTEHPQPDGPRVIAEALRTQYSVDPNPTAESFRKAEGISKLFSIPDLEGKGRLTEINCRRSICRGVIRIASPEADNEVFGRTFLSQEFTRVTPDAISVTERQVNPDGSVTATFFTHPQLAAKPLDDESTEES